MAITTVSQHNATCGMQSVAWALHCCSHVNMLTYAAALATLCVRIALFVAALRYRWVFLKDGDTSSEITSGLTAIDIPLNSVDPLTVPSYPVTYTVWTRFAWAALLCCLSGEVASTRWLISEALLK